MMSKIKNLEIKNAITRELQEEVQLTIESGYTLVHAKKQSPYQIGLTWNFDNLMNEEYVFISQSDNSVEILTLKYEFNKVKETSIELNQEQWEAIQYGIL